MFYRILFDIYFISGTDPQDVEKVIEEEDSFLNRTGEVKLSIYYVISKIIGSFNHWTFTYSCVYI